MGGGKEEDARCLCERKSRRTGREGGRREEGGRARQAKGFSGTNVKTNDSGCKAGSRGKVYGGGKEGGHAVTRVVATTRTMTISFYFRSIQRGNGLSTFIFSLCSFCSLLFSWILDPPSSGFLRSFLLSLLPGSKIFFCSTKPVVG